MHARDRSSALVAVAALFGALSATACGPSDLARAYDAYAQQVEPLLAQEQARWEQIANLLRERQDDLAMPRYYQYVEGTALPFYEGLRTELRGMEPAGDRLREAHALLLRFADARLEFVHLEVRGRELFERVQEAGELATVMSGQQEAEVLRLHYLEAVGDGVPDAKFTELYSVVDSFRSAYFNPMREGAVDPQDVQLRLKSHVVPTLEALSRRKYADTETDRLLRSCVLAWLDWHRRLEKVCPDLVDVWKAKGDSEAAYRAGEDARTAFLKALEEIRRDR